MIHATERPPGRLLLLLSTATYRASAFLEAADRLGVPVVVATHRPQALATRRPEAYLTLDAPDLASNLERVAARHAEAPFAAVLAAEDDGAVWAAEIASRLGLAHARPEAVARARDKRLMRRSLAAAGVPSPRFAVLRPVDDPAALAPRIAFPCVVKPPALSASRGVMRVDDPAALPAVARRVFAIVRSAGVAEADAELLVEDYLPGREVAVEGLLTRGELRVLAVYDKPDPLEGPVFEETIYVTPSRLPRAVLDAIAGRTAEVAAAVGLDHGPIHAELRLDGDDVWPVEIAPRSIGGLCSRTLVFGGGSLEQLILRHALGEDVSGVSREPAARAVLMLPIPSRGILHDVRGFERAAAVPGVEDVRITIPLGQEVVPLPEGDRYLGFVFARADEPASAEAALRAAHAELVFDIRPSVAVTADREEPR